MGFGAVADGRGLGLRLGQDGLRPLLRATTELVRLTVDRRTCLFRRVMGLGTSRLRVAIGGHRHRGGNHQTSNERSHAKTLSRCFVYREGRRLIGGQACCNHRTLRK